MTINDKYIDLTLRLFYEDLMKTRQQLQELKQSINQTLTDIRTLDLLLKETQTKFNQRKLFQPSEHNQMTSQTKITLTCNRCQKQFPTPHELFHHEKTQHQRCQDCKQVYFETVKDHQDYLCGGWKIKCESCYTNVERKNIDKHVKICSFRQCYKCEDKIYLKSYAYHMKVCGKENVQIGRQVTETVRNSNNLLNKNKISVLPCSLVR